MIISIHRGFLAYKNSKPRLRTGIEDVKHPPIHPDTDYNQVVRLNSCGFPGKEREIMPDPRCEKLADVLVNYSVSVEPGDWVVITGEALTAPLIRAVYARVLQAGGHPSTLISTPGLGNTFFEHAGEEQLKYVSPITKIAYQEADALISLMGTVNTRSLSGVAPEKYSQSQAARGELMKTFMQRSAEGSLQWVGTMFPCQAYAQEAEMSLDAYEDFVYCATFADREDPVAEWQAMHARQQTVVDWLQGKQRLTAKGPHVDLEMSIEGRSFENSDGRKNMPDGEIFTGPVEDSVQGWIEFTYPAMYMGREVEDVRLVFTDGKVVEASANKNEDVLLNQLEVDEGARYVGEFAIGTNDGIRIFTKNMLFDEKMAGTLHLALGASIKETGGKNDSAIHWDMLCDMTEDSEIRVDGELLYKNGAFMI
jgi:aminopeptidase